MERCHRRHGNDFDFDFDFDFDADAELWGVRSALPKRRGAAASAALHTFANLWIAVACPRFAPIEIVIEIEIGCQ